MLLIATLIFSACQGEACAPPPPPANGFRVETLIEDPFNAGLPVIQSDYDIGVFGRWGFDFDYATGDVKEFSGNTGARAYYDVPGGRAMAAWDMGELNGRCAGQRTGAITERGKSVKLTCLRIGRFPRFPFASIPSAINKASPPQSIAITGSEISAANGMPMVEYYNELGELVTQIYATAVAPDGSMLSTSAPDVYSMNAGTYMLVVMNQMTDGTWQNIGGTSIYIYDEYEPPPDPCGYSTSRLYMRC